MKFILFAVLFAFSLVALPLTASSAGPSESPPIFMLLGEQRLLQIPGLARFSLAQGSVRAQPLPPGLGSHGQAHGSSSKSASDDLLIKAVQVGPSDLWVWKTDGTAEHRVIQVDKATASPLSPRLARALDLLNEVEVYLSSTGVILRGEIQSLGEAGRVDALARGFPQEIHDETEPSDDLVNSAQKALHTWLSKSPYASRLEIDRDDRSLLLHLAHGSIAGPAERARIEKRAKAIYPLVQLDFDSLPDASPTVHFKVFLLELRKSKFRSLGLGWPAYQTSALRVTTSAIQDLIQLDLTLQTLEGDGSLKILSNPELVVRAPGDAELFSGGEIPIESKSAYFSSLTWKSFGLLLQLHVTNVSGDRVRLDITTEVSHLDPTLELHKVPGIQANRMKTQVDAEFGRPLLLSGLLQQDMRKQARGLPMLRNIPVLGALFGSEDYQNEKTELVAILVPTKEPPKNPMERIARLLPQGPMPPSRMRADLEQERKLRASSDYPWNVLQ
jgi:hypothetical protein